MPVVGSNPSSKVPACVVAARSIRRRAWLLIGLVGTCLIFAVASVGVAQVPAEKPPKRQNPSGRAGYHLEASYRLEDLGELPTIAGDVTVSLNRDGTVAYWTRVNGLVHAVRWRGGRAATIPETAGYPNTIAHAINRQGDIAGWMNTSGNLVDSLSTTRSFVSHGTRIRIVAGLGGRDSRVFGLNDKGIAVGAASLADGTRHGFVTSGSSVIDLGALGSGDSSSAYAINRAGLIVGWSSVGERANHAVLWSNRRIVDLGTLPHGAASSARSVNDRGQIAGFSDTPDGVHAFLYSDGAMQDLGTLGSNPSEASGINQRGDVVGASNLTASTRHAFLWRDGRMNDLNTFLPDDSSWVLLDAFSINDRGQIACSARRKGEPIHLLLLTPESSRR